VTHRREIMPGDVPGELAALAIPSAVTLLGFWFQPRATTQIKEHAVGFELEQVIRIEILCVFQWSARQPHIRQRQRPGGERNGVCDWAKRVRRLRSLCCRKKSHASGGKQASRSVKLDRWQIAYQFCKHRCQHVVSRRGVKILATSVRRAHI